MAIGSIMTGVNLNNTWTSVDLSNKTIGFLIAAKQTASAGDTIDVDKVKAISFELGIESGLTNKNILIDTVTLDFTALTSTDEAIDKLTAFVRLSGIPSTFFIKPVSITLDDNTIVTTGKTSINIYMNTMAI